MDINNADASVGNQGNSAMYIVSNVYYLLVPCFFGRAIGLGSGKRGKWKGGF